MTQNPFQPSRPPDDRLQPVVLLPQNPDAEASVLGSLLIDPDAIHQVYGRLQPLDFYHEPYRAIFEVMLYLADRQTPGDVITITDELDRRGRLDEIGGLTAVTSLANRVPTSANVEHYAKIVADDATLRRLIHAAGQIAGIAYSRMDAAQAAEQSRALIQTAISRHRFADSVTFIQGVKQWGDSIQSAIDRGRSNALMTGYRELDVAIGGFRPKQLIYLAARPSVGKSDLALNISQRIAQRLLIEAEEEKRAPDCVEYISLEMSVHELVTRIVSRFAGLDSRVIDADFDSRVIDVDFFKPTDDSFMEQEHNQAMRAANNAEVALGGAWRGFDLPLDFAAIDSHLTRAVAERGCRLAIIDHLHLIADREPNMTARITNLSQRLKGLAMRLNIPILCLLQMNRGSEGRANRRATWTDLRDSGSLEQDADDIITLFSGGYYDPAMDQRFLEAWVLKARSADRQAMIPLCYVKPTHQIEAWDLERHGQWPLDETRPVALPVDAGTKDELTHQQWWNDQSQGRWDIE